MSFESEIIDIRIHIHKNIEINEMKYDTSDFIGSKLKELKISHDRVGETGVIGTLKVVVCFGKTIALRSDIDTISICETSYV